MPSIKIANAPCSWGALEFDLEGKSLGYVQVLDEMAESKYIGTEYGDWGFMPTDPVKLQEELTKRNLEMLGAFVPVALVNETAHRDGLDLALKTARLIAAVGKSPYLVLADDNGTVAERTKNAGQINPEHQLSQDQWKIFTEGAEHIAKTIRDDTGLKTVFHHHCAGYVETPYEIQMFLEQTNPDLIGLCFDTGHYTYGGGDAVDGLKTFWDRIWHVHFKDCHPEVAANARSNGWNYFEAVRNGVFCELGKGSVDFQTIKNELDQQGYSGWIVVEQDVLPGMGTPLESAIRNREYLRSLGL